jgi:hypothetical protein
MLHEGETVAFGLGSASARTTCAAPREGVSAARERLAREAPAAGFAAERVKALRKGGGKGRRKGQRRAKRAQDRHPNGERDPGSRREGRDRGARARTPATAANVAMRGGTTRRETTRSAPGAAAQNRPATRQFRHRSAERGRLAHSFFESSARAIATRDAHLVERIEAAIACEAMGGLVTSEPGRVVE